MEKSYGCSKAWIQGYSGTKIYPLALTPSQILLTDIAHALALKCRFNGHCNAFYSIAEHSWHVSQLVWCPREGLLHDAAEAYLADIVSPVKPFLRDWKEIEEQAERAIASRFDLTYPWPQEVKAADTAMALRERIALMKHTSHAWNIYGDPADVTIYKWSPEDAERAFLNRAWTLGVV